MVGSMLLMKIMHCKKQQCIKQTRRSEENASRFKSVGSAAGRAVKKEPDSTVCRVCLKEGHIPIFSKNRSEDIPEALAMFGGIEIGKDDGYPKHLCASCHALLKGAILFRKTAQESDQILKKPPEVKNVDGDDFYEGMDADDDSYDFDIPIQKRTKILCKRCDMTFETREKYNIHRKSQEHENARRICPVCNKSLSIVYYRKHLQLHKLETPTHMCDICGKTFIVPGQFARHRLTHFYDLPFKCTLCPYRGRFKESLRLHMRSHTGEKPYQCSQCPSRFVSKSNLNKHQRTHAGPQDYKCEMCGRGFYTKKTLDMHLRVDHTGIKDHVCNICGKAFGYRKQMMKHQLKVHKRQKLRSGRLPLYLQVEEMRENEESET